MGRRVYLCLQPRSDLTSLGGTDLKLEVAVGFVTIAKLDFD